jgi:hypothetical protein
MLSPLGFAAAAQTEQPLGEQQVRRDREVEN